MAVLKLNNVDFFELENGTEIRLPHYFKDLVASYILDIQRFNTRMGDDVRSFNNTRQNDHRTTACFAGQAHNKVMLIKFLRSWYADRENTSLGLKDAKDIVDLYINNAIKDYLNKNINR